MINNQIALSYSTENRTRKSPFNQGRTPLKTCCFSPNASYAFLDNFFDRNNTRLRVAPSVSKGFHIVISANWKFHRLVKNISREQKYGSRKISPPPTPRKFPPIKLPPRKFLPENSHPENFHGNIPTKKISTGNIPTHFINYLSSLNT